MLTNAKISAATVRNKKRCDSVGNATFRRLKKPKRQIDSCNYQNRPIKDDEIIRIVTQHPYQNCCKNDKNCLLDNFRLGCNVDWKLVMQLYRSCKENFQFMSTQEKKIYEAKIFQDASIVKGNKIVHQWRIGNVSICSTTFRSLHEISTYRLENMSLHFKRGQIFQQSTVASSTKTLCEDATLPSLSYNETNDLFYNNLGYSGKYNLQQMI